jgi:hypothetical protein
VSEVPRRLLVGGLILCVYGAWSVVAALRGGGVDALSLGLGIAELLVGIGLLLGRPAARRWGNGLIIFDGGVTLAVGLLVSAVALLSPGDAEIHGTPVGGWSGLLAAVLFTLLTVAPLVVAYRLLNSEVVTAFLQRPRSSTSPRAADGPGGGSGMG